MRNIMGFLKEIQQVPSVPFLVKPTVEYIENFLKRHGYDFINNGYSIVVRVPKPGSPKLVVMTHTDHPGIILKNNKEGIAMGTIGIERLKKILSLGQNINLKIFSPMGKFLGRGKLVGLERKDGHRVLIESHLQVEKNSFTQFDMNYFDETQKDIMVYNADNGATYALLLALLEDGIHSEFDTYIIFNLHEEVHQISSWYLASNNILNLGHKDFVLNLECLKIENVDLKKYDKATYEGGVVLQLSNIGCLFGYKSKEENLTEKLVKLAAKNSSVKLQTGVIKDSCDSRPFSYFNLTPNIATLTIPNKNKHNQGESGKIVPEKISKKDINDFYILMKGIFNTNPLKLKNFSKIENLSKKLRQKDEITNYKLMEEKAFLNERLAAYYFFVIKRGYFYSANVFDIFTDLISKALLYTIAITQRYKFKS